MPIIIPNQKFYNNNSWWKFSTDSEQQRQFTKNERNQKRLALNPAKLPTTQIVRRSNTLLKKNILKIVYKSVRTINN